ncbi:hypothetical protein DICSQDRAFT_174515 [Dichomitus squalens LYAD-421 SS1]|uniref:Uncharacterized protein n=1 Tax=Dichomitus squalens (strain LYAD-421) TaxID=732165 RepID=R7SLT9_DICSQ|nr:uncharacterized protein DICSQDRAFT_174515 [Dichomitus squalens LYAD-421 SS1]EJF56833.1 hypothetical protein DICSQDRAFT_174515 [Dichomitus squalens LYAD-421 SS1]
MSKSSTAAAPKTSQSPSKSAWARGPPANTWTAPSPRSQSPAPSVTSSSAPPKHFRRPSTLGRGIAFKDGVGAARTPSNASRSGSSVTFGSIDDTNAPISSSPAAAPTIKSEGIKTLRSASAITNGKIHARTISFSTGTPSSGAAAAASTSSSSSTPPSTSSSTALSTSGSSYTPKAAKFDVESLFLNKTSDALSTSSAVSASPSHRTTLLPQSSLNSQGQSPHQSPPSQMDAPYSNVRPQQNSVPIASPGAPRSPSLPPPPDA